MKLIYKAPRRSKYDTIVTKLSQEFPDDIFRVKSEPGDHGDFEIGVETCMSSTAGRILCGGTWRELDLEAMGLE